MSPEPAGGSIARSLASDRGFQAEAAQLHARSALTELLGRGPRLPVDLHRAANGPERQRGSH